MKKLSSVCRACGRDFWRYPSRGKGYYCSRACFSTKQQAMARVCTCAQCGKVFTLRKGRTNPGIYCSRGCFSLARTKERLKYRCPVCGKDFERLPDKTVSGSPCCSHLCARLWRWRRLNQGWEKGACEICGKEFKYRLGTEDPGICSQRCSLIRRCRANPSPAYTIKICSHCDGEFPATLLFFGPSKIDRDGLSGWCRKCSAAATRAYKQRRKAAGNPVPKTQPGRPRFKVTNEQIHEMMLEQRGTCGYCGCLLGQRFHIDHVHPVDLGGADEMENLVLACAECNFSKHDATVREFLDRRTDLALDGLAEKVFCALGAELEWEEEIESQRVLQFSLW